MTLLAMLLALPAPGRAQEAPEPGKASLSVLPARAMAGATLQVMLDHLEVGADYRLQLEASGTSPFVLASLSAATDQLTLDLVAPTLATGIYELTLRRAAPADAPVLASQPFGLASAPGIALGPGPYQAGKPVTATLSNTLIGESVTLFYRPSQGDGKARAVWGPQRLRGSTEVRFNLPADFPASFPASMVLEARVTSGRRTLQLSSVPITVAAPHSGPFARFGAVQLGKAKAPGAPLQFSGQLELLDGTKAREIDVSLLFEANGGRRVPLAVSNVTLQDDGRFEFAIMEPKASGMTAISESERNGRIILRLNRRNLRGELELTELRGPLHEIRPFASGDGAPLRIRVRTLEGAALEGAVIEARGEVPLDLGLAQGGTLAGDPDGPLGEGLFGRHASLIPRFTQVGTPEQPGVSEAVNQLGFRPPEPLCGETLTRRITDALGLVEYPMPAALESAQAGSDPQVVLGTQIEQELLSCRDVLVDGQPRRTCRSASGRTSMFYVSVYVDHLGAGERNCNNGFCREVPKTYHVRYEQDESRFAITDLATGEVQESFGQALIDVRVRQTPSQQPLLRITGPYMKQDASTEMVVAPQVPRYLYDFKVTFGRWVNFSRAAQGVEFQYDKLGKRMWIFHEPGAGGSLQSVQLYMSPPGQNSPTVHIGDFVRRSDLASCDAALAGRGEEWRLDFNRDLTFVWRRPDGVFLAPGQNHNCGELRFTLPSGEVVRRGVCFEWQDPPAVLAGLNFLDVNDANVDHVRVSGQQSTASQVTTSPRPPDVLGRRINEPGPARNENSRSVTAELAIGKDGIKSGQRSRRQDIAAQMNRARPSQVSQEPFFLGPISQTTTLPMPTLDKTVLDVDIPFLRWYWGIPGFGANVAGDLRILSKLLAEGTRRLETDGRETINYTTQLTIATGIAIGARLQILLGLLFDAGATISGWVISHMPTRIVDNVPQSPNLCMEFRIDFEGYVDFAPPLPRNPVTYHETRERIFNHFDPPGCRSGVIPLITTGKAGELDRPMIGIEQLRQLSLQPTIGFDGQGNGQVLALDSQRRLLARRMQAGQVATEVVLSTAPGINGPKLVYYAPDRAVAMWTQSRLSEAALERATLDEMQAGQHVVWSRWNGVAWSEPAQLDTAGREGNIALAACPAGRAGCPLFGEVFAVWQRQILKGGSEPVNQLMSSTGLVSLRGGGVLWSAPAAVDSRPGAFADITPAATYMGNRPVAVWIRHDLGDFDKQVASRRLYYRVFKEGQASQAVGLPVGLATPDVIGLGASGLRVVFTLPDPDTGLIGNRLALHTASANCVLGDCSFSVQRALDAAGRSLYGELPRLLASDGDEPKIFMRLFRTSMPANEGDEPDDDPLGVLLGSGDLVSITSRFDSSPVQRLPITVDGAMHYASAAGIDPASGQLVALSTVFVPEFMPQMKSMLAGMGRGTLRGHAESKSLGGLLEMHVMEALPDLLVESVSANTLQPQDGAPLALSVTLANRGVAFDPARDGEARLELRWDGSEGVGAPALSLPVPALGAGERLTWTPSVALPTDLLPGQPRSLFLRIVSEAGLLEVDRDNNSAELQLEGLPVPQDLGVQLVADVAFTQISWPAVEDPRVSGYRVYADDGDGVMLPLGSTPVNGFLDLSSDFGLPRLYRVAAITAQGVESPLSDPVLATPFRTLGDAVFDDGFEADPTGGP